MLNEFKEKDVWNLDILTQGPHFFMFTAAFSELLSTQALPQFHSYMLTLKSVASNDKQDISILMPATFKLKLKNYKICI